MTEGIFPVEDWLKVGSGEMTGFMVEYKIPGTKLSILYDAGNKFWNMSDQEKDRQACIDAMVELLNKVH